MYNPELKTKFVNEFTTSESRRNAAVVMFNTLQSYEEKWGADVCTIRKEELEHVVGEIVGFREKSKRMRLSILKAYVKWCTENGVENVTNAIYEIEDFGLDKLRRQMVKDPAHLQRYMNCIFDSESEETNDSIYRCVYWLAYAGIKNEEDAQRVFCEDVDLDKHIITFEGCEYPIYEEAFPALRNCKELKEFRYKHSNYNRDTFKRRAASHVLLRGQTIRKSKSAIRVELSRKAKDARYMTEKDKQDDSLKLKLSYYRVWLSGLFYRVYLAEKDGMPADFTAAAKEFMEGKIYKLDSGRNLIGAKQRQLARDYLSDYTRWKEAYSL